MSILKTDYIQFGEDLYEIVPPTPTETDRGGIIASPKRESDVIEARLGDDGKLYVGSMDANLSNYYNKDEVDEIIETIKEDFDGSVNPEISVSWNDIKDKPFGETSNKTVLIPETTRSADSASRTIPFDETALDWTLGNKVNVIFDGNKYEATCINNSDDWYEYRFYTSETGYIGFWESGVIDSYDKNFDFSGGVEHTFEVYTGESTIHKIDEKYLPDEVALKSDIENKKDKDFIITISGNFTDGFTSDKTFEEIKEAYNAGVSLYAVSDTTKLECNRVSSSNARFNYYSPFGMIYHTLIIKSDNTVTYTTEPQSADPYFYGGVTADPKSDTDTVPAKIGEDGRLYVPTYPTLNENGGNSSPFIVDITSTLAEDGIVTFSADKTATEIHEAYVDGKYVYATLGGDGGSILTLTQCQKNFALFQSTSTAGKYLSLYMVTNTATIRNIAYFYDKTEVDSLLENVSPKIDIDSEISSESTNPVQNKAIKEYVDAAVANSNVAVQIIKLGVDD